MFVKIFHNKLLDTAQPATGYEIVLKKNTDTDTNTYIDVGIVPEDFFESYDAYDITSDRTLCRTRRLTKRITMISNLAPTDPLRKKIEAIPYARERLAKTNVFINL